MGKTAREAVRTAAYELARYWHKDVSRYSDASLFAFLRDKSTAYFVGEVKPGRVIKVVWE
jgi:hypothetical protein